MRTTLTLETDVARLIDRLRRERRVSLKELVNEGLRLGLSSLAASPRRKPSTYRTVPVAGRPKIATLDTIAGVIALVEGGAHR
ncbi:MAG: hypothetical protein HYZ27_05390 [Deltaproteobacteria bacterium]|nr:hypothetical protein [Deltaproteobacteria bacterium]